MSEQYDVKITVVRRLSPKDIFGPALPKLSLQGYSGCVRLSEGDSFISEKGACPDGFCPWAFADIHRDMTHVRFGGSYPWMEDQGLAYSSCTDGLGPVIFKLERVVRERGRDSDR